MVREELTLGEMVTLLKLRRERLVIEEVQLDAGSPVVGKAIKDMSLPEETLVATVLRESSNLIPRGDLTLMAGDKVLFVTDPDKVDILRGVLGLD